MNKKRIIIVFTIIIAILFISSMIYLCTGNYNADQEALNYLNSTEIVNVSKIKEGYYFDGLGKDSAIVFYPGAKVEYTAYAELMYKIAENGSDCFLIKMPFNMAIFGVNKAQNIINQYEYKNWYISGHSMGGAMACMYVSDHPEKIKGVISLAAYPAKTLPKDIEYISIYGSEDKVLNKEKYNNAKQYLPNNNAEYVIEGGNHSGFANYGEQKGDGKAILTNAQQQEYTINKLFERNILNKSTVNNEKDDNNINKVEENSMKTLQIIVNKQVLNVELENNSSAQAFLEKIKDKDVVVDAQDYGNFEKVGDLGFDLPTNDERITTEPGDLILYQGNQITLYYDTNTWNFTKLGKVKGVSQKELKKILGNGAVTLTFKYQ